MKHGCTLLLALAGLACTSCGTQPSSAEPAKAEVAVPTPAPAAKTPPAGPVRSFPMLEGEAVVGPLVVTHAGVGSPMSERDGAEAAAAAAHARLAQAPDALEAAVAGTIVLEDDPRYNAGTGANIRLDGKTIQMDAALMTGAGKFAAVAAIERVKNPIEVARLVMDSPHIMLVGEGATRFAHKLGIADEVPESPQARKKYEGRMKRLAEVVGAPGSREVDWRTYWNFPGEMPQDMVAWRHGGDTVGTVVRTAAGEFAAALSTGGTSVTLYGRVGDVPIYGAGLFAGPAGAVACTGDGEEIVKRFVAREVYAALEAGSTARDAVKTALERFPEPFALGVIAVGRDGFGVAATASMAWGKAGG